MQIRKQLLNIHLQTYQNLKTQKWFKCINLAYDQTHKYLCNNEHYLENLILQINYSTLKVSNLHIIK